MSPRPSDCMAIEKARRPYMLSRQRGTTNWLLVSVCGTQTKPRGDWDKMVGKVPIYLWLYTQRYLPRMQSNTGLSNIVFQKSFQKLRGVDGMNSSVLNFLSTVAPPEVLRFLGRGD